MSTGELISKLEAAKISLVYIDERASDFVFVSGLRCDKGALDGISLPEHRSSVRKIFDLEEIDDEGFQVYGPTRSNDLPQTRFGQRLVAVRWRDASWGKQWSMHVLRLAVKEQDLLYFDGVVAVPKGWSDLVDVYIGLWSGHHGAHWRNWRGGNGFVGEILPTRGVSSFAPVQCTRSIRQTFVAD